MAPLIEETSQLVAPGPITGYEHARAQLGVVADGDTPAESQAK